MLVRQIYGVLETREFKGSDGRKKILNAIYCVKIDIINQYEGVKFPSLI